MTYDLKWEATLWNSSLCRMNVGRSQSESPEIFLKTFDFTLGKTANWIEIGKTLIFFLKKLN